MYPALSDIESTESDRYNTETYTDDDNEHQLMNRYMYNSQDEDDDNDRYVIVLYAIVEQNIIIPNKNFFIVDILTKRLPERNILYE